MPQRLNRRTVLRGVGAAVGLPILECMLNANGTAFAQAGSCEALCVVFAVRPWGRRMGQ
jgi:hypothetical protein